MRPLLDIVSVSGVHISKKDVQKLERVQKTTTKIKDVEETCLGDWKKNQYVWFIRETFKR